MGWQQKLRSYQDHKLNAGWRIKVIPHDDTSKPMVVYNGGLALTGGSGMCLAFFLLFTHRVETALALKLFVGSLALCLFGVWFHSWRKALGWQEVEARCIDRELRNVQVEAQHGYASGWCWRVVCEYEFHAQKITVTPGPQPMICASEADAMKFISKRVAADGSCRLRINPDNPVQTKLLAQK
jgi:hypothetical protein